MAPHRYPLFHVLFPLTAYICIHIIQCVRYEVIQERAVFVYYDPDYFKNVTLRTGRRGRGFQPETNLTIVVRYPMGNNVTVNNTIYELRSNEYRRGFVDISYKICDMIDHERLIAPLFNTALGKQLTCPVLGKYFLHISNMDTGIFRSLVPWTKIKLDSLFYTNDNNIIFRTFFYMRFEEILDKERPRGNKSSRGRKSFK